jgi:hypothetical protein
MEGGQFPSHRIIFGATGVSQLNGNLSPYPPSKAASRITSVLSMFLQKSLIRANAY